MQTVHMNACSAEVKSFTTPAPTHVFVHVDFMEARSSFDKHPVEIISVVRGDDEWLNVEDMLEELDEQSVFVILVEYCELACGNENGLVRIFI